MEHRHLLPDEIELLVDGEEGFGMAPLVAHIERCESCRREVDAQRRVVAELESLPHFAPSPLFAYKVMKNVQVFEPWHVSAMDTLRRFVPQSGVGRVLAGSVAVMVTMTLTLISSWIVLRYDNAAFVFNVAMARLRDVALQLTSAMGTALLGDSGAALVRSNGTASIAVASSVLLLTLIGAAFGLRRVADASRRRRA